MPEIYTINEELLREVEWLINYYPPLIEGTISMVSSGR
jgi:hypothetical protein